MGATTGKIRLQPSQFKASIHTKDLQLIHASTQVGSSLIFVALGIQAFQSGSSSEPQRASWWTCHLHVEASRVALLILCLMFSTCMQLDLPSDPLQWTESKHAADIHDGPLGSHKDTRGSYREETCYPNKGFWDIGNEIGTTFPGKMLCLTQTSQSLW